ILSFTADNAACNDTQTVHLAKLNSKFDPVYRVRCFNHTLNLSAKAILKPF
ncbi:hypothetical protein C8R43DRAFT_834604, partial [Mycena crocata]